MPPRAGSAAAVKLPLRDCSAALVVLFVVSYAAIHLYAARLPEPLLGDAQYTEPIHLQPEAGADTAPLQLNALGVARSAQFPPYGDVDRTAEANLCFFVQLSDTSLPMAPRLVARLWHPRNVILLHVDAKVPDAAVAQLTATLAASAARYANVHILPRETITYAGISMLLNTLGAMEFALSLDQPWDYFINLSGSDYPLISVRNMRILYGQPRALRQRVSFIQYSHGGRFWADLQRQRFNLAYADPALGLPPNSREKTALVKSWKRHPAPVPLKVGFAHAEAWLTAHRTLVHESARGAYARRLLPLLANAMDPEEHFFAMLAWNTALNKTAAHYAARSIFWYYNGKRSGQHPYTVDTQDVLYAFWNAMASAPGIFARKFSRPDSPLLDRIDAELAGVAPQSNVTSVAAKFRIVLLRNMCSADIDRQWNQPPRYDFSACLPPVQ